MRDLLILKNIHIMLLYIRLVLFQAIFGWKKGQDLFHYHISYIYLMKNRMMLSVFYIEIKPLVSDQVKGQLPEC